MTLNLEWLQSATLAISVSRLWHSIITKKAPGTEDEQSDSLAIVAKYGIFRFCTFCTYLIIQETNIEIYPDIYQGKST